MPEIVFRVEHPYYGIGPFLHKWRNQYAKRVAMKTAHPGPKGLRCPWDIPCPQAERLYGINSDHQLVCGFHRISLLLEWFPPKTRELMALEGFLLYKFEAKEVYSAVHQCVFRRPTATPLKSYRLVA